MQGLSFLLTALGWLVIVIVAIIIFIWALLIISGIISVISMAFQKHKQLKLFKNKQAELKQSFQKAEDRWNSK